jgi:hypothetical protein
VNDWSLEETDNPLLADDRNFYKVEQWTKDDQRVTRMLWAGNSLDKARAIFNAEAKRRPRGRYTIGQRSRVLAKWPRQPFPTSKRAADQKDRRYCCRSRNSKARGAGLQLFGISPSARRPRNRPILIEISPVLRGIIFHRSATGSQPMRNSQGLPETSIGRKVWATGKSDQKTSADRRGFSDNKRTPMPHSRASLTMLPGGRRVLEPPREFAEGSIERAIFVETVLSVPDDHFAPEDSVLLAEYCRSAALARRASEELAASAVSGSTPSPWLAVHSSAVRSVALLSTRLRLGPRSRSHNIRKGKPTLPPSYYDLHPVTRP